MALIAFAIGLDPDHKMVGLISIQTVCHFDGITERISRKVDFEKKSADNKRA